MIEKRVVKNRYGSLQTEYRAIIGGRSTEWFVDAPPYQPGKAEVEGLFWRLGMCPECEGTNLVSSTKNFSAILKCQDCGKQKVSPSPLAMEMLETRIRQQRWGSPTEVGESLLDAMGFVHRDQGDINN